MCIGIVALTTVFETNDQKNGALPMTRLHVEVRVRRARVFQLVSFKLTSAGVCDAAAEELVN